MKLILSIFHRFENTVMVLLLGLLIGLSFAQVGGRLLVNSGFESGDAIIYHLVLWSGLWGAVLATRQREHITIDIVSRFVHGRKRHLIQALTNSFSFVICAVLFYAAIAFIQDERSFNNTSLAGIPVWIWQLIIPYALMTMCIRFCIHAVQDCMDCLRPQPESDS